VTLLEGKPREIVNTYTEAVQTVDPKQAVGKLYTLWVNFAKFYENNKQGSLASFLAFIIFQTTFFSLSYI
jgi:hypothetical protein